MGGGSSHVHVPSNQPIPGGPAIKDGDHGERACHHPDLLLGPSDMKISVHDANGKLGELHLSQGSVDWWDRNAKKAMT